MDNLLAARSQMAMSLGFHIVFAAVGMAMPLLMVIAEALHLRTRDVEYLVLARRWARGTGIMFAVGAVSGTVLSFELGLLWPEFMALAGPVVAMPFSLEGFAFFLEAIFLGIYLYGWKRVSPSMHLFSGVMVALSGLASTAFVVTANAWMNTPTGFTVENGRVVDVDILAAMFNPAAPTQVFHMIFAAFVSVGFAVSGVHALMLLKHPGNTFHQKALTIALVVGGVSALIQGISGDLSAQHVAQHQPVKLAAMEAQWETEVGAPLHLGGIPDEDDEVTRYSINIPYGLSLLAHHDPHARIRGLKEFPKENRPNVLIVHLAFQVMVGVGSLLVVTGLLALLLRWRGRKPWEEPRYLKLLVLCAPLGFVALEAGWTVTEVGRQPWVIHGVMRTRDAVTTMPHLQIPFLVFTGLYVFLAVVVVALMRAEVGATSSAEEAARVS